MNRAIRLTESGFEYEADPRPAERLLEGLGLDGVCESVANPDVKPLIDLPVEDAVLPVSASTGFRGQAARAKLLGGRQDRPPARSQGGIELHERANGDVRGRHEAPGALPTPAQASCVDVSIPESRGHRSVH